MTDMQKVLGLCLVCAILSLVLRRASAEMGMLFKIAATVTLGAICILALLPIVEYIRSVFDITGVGKYGEVLIKALCISLLSGVCAMICKDAGEENIAFFALWAGRIEIIILSLPIIEDVLGAAVKLLEFV